MEQKRGEKKRDNKMILIVLLLVLLVLLMPHAESRMLPIASVVCKDSNAEASRMVQLSNFVAGGLAGTVASTLTMPLEVVKTQLQSSTSGGKTPVSIFKAIMSTSGPKGLFRGIKPMLFGIMPTRAIYFWAYATSKASLNTIKVNDRQVADKDSPLNHLLSAFAAGITSNTLTNPLWMVKTRFQIIPDQSLGQIPFQVLALFLPAWYIYIRNRSVFSLLEIVCFEMQPSVSHNFLILTETWTDCVLLATTTLSSTLTYASSP